MYEPMIVDNGIPLSEVKERAVNLCKYLDDEGLYVKANTVYLLMKAIELLEEQAKK